MGKGTYGSKRGRPPAKRKDRPAKMSPPARDSGKRMTPAQKQALKKRLVSLPKRNGRK